MSKLKFKPADFITLDYGNAIPAAIVANTKLDEHLASCPVVYGYIGAHGSSWNSEKPGTFIQENINHTARLVDIQELPKAECEHEPAEQAFLTVATDGERLSLSRDELTKLFSTYRKCKHCGIELKAAKWEAK